MYFLLDTQLSHLLYLTYPSRVILIELYNMQEDARSPIEEQIKSLRKRVDILEEESREEIPRRSLDYHLWTLFFTLGFLVLSFVFSGDVEHYLHYLSNPPVSLSVSRDNPDTLVLERYNVRFFHDATPSDMNILIRLNKSASDLQKIKEQVRIECSITEGQRLPFNNYAFDAISVNSLTIKIPSFNLDPKSTQLANKIFIDFPARYRESQNISDLAVGVDTKVIGGKYAWYAKSFVFMFIFWVFTYVVYFNCKTFGQYMKEFVNYSHFVWQWISFIGLDRLKNQRRDDILAEESLLDFHRRTSGKYLFGRDRLEPYEDTPACTMYRIIISPGKYRYWSRVFSILKPITIDLQYVRYSKENGQAQPPLLFTSTPDWKADDLTKFKPLFGLPNPIKWLIWPNSILYIFVIGIIVVLILLYYVQTIWNSSAVLYTTGGVLLWMLLKDVALPRIKRFLKLLGFKFKS